jgi:hypothetical protein
MQQIILKDNDTNGKYSTRRITMLSFLKKIFGSKPAESTAVPYKVESPVVEAPKVEQFPFPAPAEKKTADKKPAAKAKTARKSRAPKTPK